jgi:hypothetical protein
MTQSFLFRLCAAGLLLLTTACTKVVDLDLQDADPRVMIEANLANDGHPATVRLSRSANYKDTNLFPPVTSAVITLSDDAGGLETLQETSPGQYQGRTLTGQPGRRYTLRVEADGQSYVAQSTMPAAVPLTGLRVALSDFTDEPEAVPEYQDPAGVRNYYLFRQYRNGQLNKSLFVRDDELTDGKVNTQGLSLVRAKDEDKLVSGDSVRVEMQTIDVDVHEYLRTLNQVVEGLGSPAPANPKSNFSGDALGYFSAHTLQRRSQLVP